MGRDILFSFKILMTTLETRKPQPHKENPPLKAPAEVSLVLGEQSTNLIANLQTAIEVGRDITLMPNVYLEKFRPQPVAIVRLEGEVSTAFATVQRIAEVLDKTPTDVLEKKEEIVRAITVHQPVIAREVVEKVEKIKASKKIIVETAGQVTFLEQKVDEVDDVDSLDPSQTAQLLLNAGWLKNTLADRAEALPTEPELFEAEAFIAAESMAQNTDALIAGFEVYPEFITAFEDASGKEERAKITSRVLDRGDRDPGVIARHRPRAEQRADLHLIEDTKSLFKEVVISGATLLDALKGAGPEMLQHALLLQIGLLSEARLKNEQVLRDQIEQAPEAAQQHITNALITEDYLATSAKKLGTVMSIVRAKINSPEVKKQLQDLVETPLAREIRKAAKKEAKGLMHVSNGDEYQAVSYNDMVAKGIRIARHVIKGGIRLDEQAGAKKMARDLHEVVFPKKKSVERLELPEAGVIVAVLTGNFDAFKDMVDRCRAYVDGDRSDIQIAKLKSEHLELFSSLAHLNLEKIAGKIVEILNTPKLCERLYNILHDEQRSTVRQHLMRVLSPEEPAQTA